MEAAGCERPAIFGIFEGGPMSALFAASHPDRVSSLVLFGTFARKSAEGRRPPAQRRAGDHFFALKILSRVRTRLVLRGRSIRSMAGSGADRAPETDAERVRRLSAIFAQPIHLKLLSALAAESRLGADTLADRVGEPVHKVRRHLNVLLSLGLVEVVGTEGRRGAMKRYFAVDRSEAWIGATDYTHLTLQERRRADIGVLRLIFEEATRAASSPRLGERADEVVANISERVDEQGWQELSELHHDMLERAMEIVAASRARLAASDGEAVGFISQQILFESPQNALDAAAEPRRSGS